MQGRKHTVGLTDDLSCKKNEKITVDSTYSKTYVLNLI